MEKIDITPSWEAITPLLIQVVADGNTPRARQEAREQIMLLARTVDAMNAQAREEADASAFYRDEYLPAADLMQKMGGSFACAIADAFIAADSHNARRLIRAFPELFERYRKMAAIEQVYDRLAQDQQG